MSAVGLAAIIVPVLGFALWIGWREWTHWRGALPHRFLRALLRDLGSRDLQELHHSLQRATLSREQRLQALAPGPKRGVHERRSRDAGHKADRGAGGPL